MRYALIENNQVKDIFIEPEGVSIEECFTPEIVSLYIECPNNIAEGDFYNSETQEFSENPDKKFPNYPEWFSTLQDKSQEISSYALNLSPIINNFPMKYERLDEYQKTLSYALNGVTDDVEIDGQHYTSNDFKLMVDALKKFEQDKELVQLPHLTNISSFNNAQEIDAYDFTTGWPETNISI
jgi:hypothetical protein